MSSNERLHSIDIYIDQIDRLLPYSDQKKAPVLEGLRKDVVDAMADSDEADPALVFGPAREVASNLSKSHDWGTGPAGWWIRTLAFLVDTILVVSACLVYLAFGLVVVLQIDIWQLLTLSEFSEVADNFFANLDLVTALILTILALIYCLGAVALYCSYFVVLERNFAATIGKKLLGLRAVDLSGIKLTWKQAIIRNFTKFPGIVEFLPFDIILGILKMEKGQGEYQKGTDILAETSVVKSR